MGIRDRAARALVYRLPTSTGLYRLQPHLAIATSCETLTTRIRGYPLRIRYRPSTYMGWFLYFRGMYEEGPVHALDRLLRPGMGFVDVGANIGMYTIIAAHLVGEAGRVLALEPQRQPAALLQDNLRINRLGNVVVLPAAAGAKEGAAVLHQVSRSNDGQATLQVLPGEPTFGESEPVACRTLSRILPEHEMPRAYGAKIDVEGAELEVLRGFDPYLRGHPPAFILIEVIEEHLRRFGATPREVLAFLQDHRYEVYCHRRGAWHRLADAADHGRYGHSPDLLGLAPGTSRVR
jgi:FkbM family methyltransferase